MSTAVLRENFERHLRQTLARDRYSATDRDRYYALALAVRDQLVDRWISTQQTHHTKNVKRVYYLSLEFLIGRMMGNNVINLQMEEVCRAAMSQEGLDWEDLREYEIDAGLGNGGLGRLAACFLDSIATLDLPAVGYGLRYDFGIFKQNIKNGYQVEQPEEWLKHRYPWEIPHPEFSFEVQFEGHVETRSGPRGPEWRWVDTKPVIGIAYDLPVVGYGGRTVNTLRLWSAKSAEEFDLDDFNRGEYVEAVANKVLAENLTKVLYPDDTVFAGKELRLKQEYFFVSCTIQDIVRRFKSDGNAWESFPDKVFLQLNDTHPALVIPELMRLLMDREGLEWDQAWRISTASTGYTNHTILPEALEKWPIPMFRPISEIALHARDKMRAAEERAGPAAWPVVMRIVVEGGGRARLPRLRARDRHAVARRRGGDRSPARRAGCAGRARRRDGGAEVRAVGKREQIDTGSH